MAGMIVKEDIEKVRNAADLYDLVSATVTLKPSGMDDYVGLCPFHDEKTPSFSVKPSMGVWHCFGCGRGGDVFKYVEESEGIDFREAVEYLADVAHIDLHYTTPDGGKDRAGGSKRSRLLEACEAAQAYFTAQLMTDEALPARQLLAGRNFAQEDCARFGCGYAPRGWDNLVRHLASKGFSQKEMLDAGLARQGQRGPIDYFRGRATWPIRDVTGRIVGFGARKLYDDDTMQGKYINTPDTELYHKNQVLYGIDLAKEAIRDKRQVVVVEGYTDVMAMHLAGVDTAVATCGTAFTEEHAKAVRRLVKDDSLGAVQLIGPLRVDGQALSSRVVFTFDGDAAGQKAALHAFGLDNAFLSQTFVAVADDNLDPCDLRIQRGDAAVRALVEHATPLVDFVVDSAINRFDTSYTMGQLGAVKAVAPLIARIRDRSMYDMYTRKAARRIGVELDQMRAEVRTARQKLGTRDEDAYAGRRRQGEPGERKGGLSDAQMRAIERGNANSQTFYRIPDHVFIYEQQFMATLIQLPLAINAELFRALTVHCFQTSVFQSLFTAVQVAGGLPDSSMTQGQWLHNLTKAGGPELAGAINELAVMALPLPDEGNHQASDVDPRLVDATPAQRQYANELIARLLDSGYMRRIAAAKSRARSAKDMQEQIQLLGVVTETEMERKTLQQRIFGNAAG
ncbi:MAG: DNA primase [Bifidobacterium sp.]|nr:DNA primase [Bifidobacterium sp.]